MTHLKEVIAEELREYSADSLEKLSEQMTLVVSLTLKKKGYGYEEGVLHRLLDELWSMIILEQRNKMQELKNEEERFSI